MNRRHFLNTALRGTASLAASASLGTLACAQATCAPRTADNIEGPFFRPGAPDRADLLVPGEVGTPLALTGRVLDAACRPIQSAVIEVWHADAAGEYDEQGFAHRGVLRCDASGRYQLHTIVPGRYLNGAVFRPAHVHVKVHGSGQEALTTQLYFPGDPYNDGEPWIRSSLMLQGLVRDAGALSGRFDFTL